MQDVLTIDILTLKIKRKEKGEPSMKLSKLGLILTLGTILAVLSLISSIPPVIAQGDNIGIRGDSITISAILLQNGTYGMPISDQVIEFYDQTQNFLLNYGITNDEGVASIIWNIPIDYPLGPTTLNTTYRGNESLFLAPSCQWIIINILSPTHIILEHDEEVLAPGDILSFNTLLLDDSSIPIQCATISVVCGDILLATAITNSSGRVTFSIHCNSSWIVLGENIINVIYEQDLDNYHSKAEKSLVIEIQQIATQVITSPIPEQSILGDQININITLSEIEGGIPAELEIFLDGNFLTSIWTDSLGKCALELEIDERFSLGSHTLLIAYNGNQRYLESVITGILDVFSFVSLKYEAGNTAIVKANVEFNIKVYDTLNRPISGRLHILDLTNGYNTIVEIPTGSIDCTISFQVMGPVGLHNLSVKLENPFTFNATTSFNYEVWSLPIIELTNTNVFHYASPSQEITFIIRLTGFSGNISFKSILLLLDNHAILSCITNENGIAIIVTDAPITEGIYNYSIFCPQNFTRYELQAKLDYQLIVSKKIPIIVNLCYYEIIPPLQMISIKILVVCLNGSLLEGIVVEFEWFSTDKLATTQEGGEIILQLYLPSISGNYSLYYEIRQTTNLAHSSGTISLSITYTSILASQGVGIGGFVISFVVSSIIIMIPIIRQRYPS